VFWLEFDTCVRIIYTMKEKTKIYVSMLLKKLHYILENVNTKWFNKIEKVKNIMWACQGVNLLWWRFGLI
jgi:uncharacterized protein (UPF0248 family)